MLLLVKLMLGTYEMYQHRNFCHEYSQIKIIKYISKCVELLIMSAPLADLQSAM